MHDNKDQQVTMSAQELEDELTEAVRLIQEFYQDALYGASCDLIYKSERFMDKHLHRLKSSMLDTSDQTIRKEKGGEDVARAV